MTIRLYIYIYIYIERERERERERDIRIQVRVAKLDTAREPDTTRHEISRLWVRFNGFMSYSG